jgi:hypothetical protein
VALPRMLASRRERSRTAVYLGNVLFICALDLTGLGYDTRKYFVHTLINVRVP